MNGTITKNLYMHIRGTKNHIILSNLSSFDTLRIDLMSSRRKTPALHQYMYIYACHSEIIIILVFADSIHVHMKYTTYVFYFIALCRLNCYGSSPAATKEPLAMFPFPWLLNVTPMFRRVPPETAYIVAICSMVALRAARSDWKVWFHSEERWEMNEVKIMLELE